MINNDRIVPVTVTDLIDLYGTIVKFTSQSVSSIDATTTDGQFELTTDSLSDKFCSEPVSKFNLTGQSSPTPQIFYFVPAYNYSGFVINGTPIVTTGSEVIPDGKTLYQGTLTANAVSIRKIGI